MPVTLNSIPTQTDELVRALVTTGTAEWWYNNRIGDTTVHGSFTGDMTIVADPTPGETETDVELLIGTLRWRGAGGSTSDQFLVRRNDPAPPAARGFNGWLTQGRVTGDDRVRLNQITFQDGDPGLIYSVFFQFTDDGDVIELELREVLGSSIGTGHHFMNLRIPSDHHAAFDAVAANQAINVVIAQRTSLKSGDGGDISVAVALSQAQGSKTSDHAVDGSDISVAIAVSQATGTKTSDHAVDGGDIGVAVAISQAQGTKTSQGAVDGGDITVAVALSQATGTKTSAHAVDGGDIAVAVAVSQAQGTKRTGAGGDGGDITVAVAVSQATGTLTATGGVNPYTFAPRTWTLGDAGRRNRIQQLADDYQYLRYVLAAFIPNLDNPPDSVADLAGDFSYQRGWKVALDGTTTWTFKPLASSVGDLILVKKANIDFADLDLDSADRVVRRFFEL